MSVPSDLIRELERILGSGQLRHHPLERRLFAKDAGMLTGHDPSVVVFPATREEAAAVVTVAHHHGVPLVTRGTGTGLAGGAVPDGGVSVVTTRLNRIGEIDPEAGTAWVEPGVLNLDLSRHTSRWGLHFAPDPASQAACSIGGNVAANAGGPHGLAEGSTTDHVLAVEVITADGTITVLGDRRPTLSDWTCGPWSSAPKAPSGSSLGSLSASRRTRRRCALCSWGSPGSMLLPQPSRR